MIAEDFFGKSYSEIELEYQAESTKVSRSRGLEYVTKSNSRSIKLLNLLSPNYLIVPVMQRSKWKLKKF